MLEDIKQLAGVIAPPAALSIGLSVLILRVHNQTQLDWPILGEFIMDDALKAVMIAIVWFLFFAGWALWKKLVPNYRDEVYKDVSKARSYLQNIYVIGATADNWEAWSNDLNAMEFNIPKGRNRDAFKEVKRWVWTAHLFSKSSEIIGEESSPTDFSAYSDATKRLPTAVKKFLEQTEWVSNKT